MRLHRRRVLAAAAGAAAVATLSGCETTEYGPLGPNGGVGSTFVAPNWLVLRAEGDFYVRLDKLKGFVRRKAAEDALAGGFEGYVIEKEVADEHKRWVYHWPSWSSGDPRKNRPPVYIPGWSELFTAPTVDTEVTLVRAPMPDPLPRQAYRAKMVLELMRVSNPNTPPLVRKR